jgi:hypothetical protein
MTDLHPTANESVVHPIAAIGFTIVKREESATGLDVMSLVLSASGITNSL